MTIDEMIMKRARYAGITGGCGIATSATGVMFMVTGTPPLMAISVGLFGLASIMWAKGEVSALAAISAQQAREYGTRGSTSP